MITTLGLCKSATTTTGRESIMQATETAISRVVSILLKFMHNTRVVDPTKGLCAEVSTLGVDEGVLFYDCIQQVANEDRDMCVYYPIDDLTVTVSAKEQYYAGNLYSGEQLRLRVLLAKAVISILMGMARHSLTEGTLSAILLEDGNIVQNKATYVAELLDQGLYFTPCTLIRK